MSAKHARSLALRGGTVLAIGTSVLLAAGTAYAYWSVAGAGDGTGAAGTASALTGGTATSTGLLYPGGSVPGTVVLTNPNPTFDVLVSAVSFGSAVPDAGHAGCTTTGVTFTWTDTTLTVPKGGTATLSYTAAMSNASLNACQGATFTAPFTVTDGRSVAP